jgi:hypothetical protein
MPDCLALVRYRNCPGIVSFFYSGTGLIGCWTVRHSGIYTHEHAHEHALAHAHTPMMWGMKMDRNMDVQHGHETWTWTIGHTPLTWRWTGTMNAGMPECR